MKTMKPQQNKSGIPYGVLWGFIVMFAYVWAYFAVAWLLLPNTSELNLFKDWLILISSSVAYLLFGLVGFVFVLMMAFYFSIRDPEIYKNLSKHWPLALVLLWFIFGPIPGPIDDLVVAILSTWLYLWRRRKFSEAIENETSSERVNQMMQNHSQQLKS
ncbi:MAG: hypothetical protein WD048_06075 [Chitinophagales bacterium]